MKIEHLPLLQSVSAPTLHPDGTRVVAAVTRPDLTADAYVGQLWEVPVEGGTLRRLTRGFRDTAPQYSHNGELLAFLRAGPDGPAQLFFVEAGGGEPRQLTDAKLGVQSFDWSPDSQRIVYAARVPEEGRYGTVDGVPAGAEDARVITGYQFRMNGVGYTADKRLQLFVLEVPPVDAEPPVAPRGRARKALPADEPFSAVPPSRQLTDADADHTAPRFAPDGSTILFTAALHDGAEADLVSDVYLVPVDGGTPERLTNQGVPEYVGAAAATYSADGRWLFHLASDLGTSGRDFVGRHTSLFVAEAANPANVRRLTDPASIDLTENGDRLVTVGPDAVLVLDRSRGGVRLLRISADGQTQVLVDGPRLVLGVDAVGETVAVSYTDGNTVGDLAVVAQGSDTSLRPLTDFSAAFRNEAGVVPLHEVSYQAPDGYPVHGWLLLPEGPGPHPVLLNIHGGPFAQYGWGLFDEAQVYAAAGYAVLMCNPRGAAGYGLEHGKAIKEAMGTVDLDDVLAFLDGALAEHGELDNERLGVMGGSYGGYLTAWTIAHDHRFTAAIVERGYLDPVSFVGSSDIGWFFSNEYTGEDPDAIRAQSPMAVVDQVQTPTLVLHSEDDLRCPVEQAHRYYTALKMGGVPTELVVFPGENHELSRSGTPHHRKQRFEHILNWWSRYLPTEANPA
ncbi:MAG: peptidase [Micrococcaceae bacterium]|nr:peptidase [Micrococcaceae bacterium]